MNKELEEAKERLNNFKTIKILYGNTYAMHLEQLEQLQNDIELALKALDNSISKEVIEKKIEENKKEYGKIRAQHYRDCGISENRIQAKILAYQELLEGK